jgi:raffinose/stachyose/melibiose transport system substrate-binding protein
MKNAMRRSLTMGAAIAAASLALAGCSGGSDGGGGGGTLTIAGPSSYDLAIKAVAEQFMAENPDIKVETTTASTDQYQQTARTQLASGTAPDILYVWSGGANSMSVWNVAKEGVLEDLSNESWVDIVPEDQKDLAQYDGKTYMLPMVYGAIGAMYNTAVYEDAGVEVPTTYPELLNACHDLADAGYVPFAVGLQTPAHTQLISYALVASTVYATDPDFNQQMDEGTADFADSGWRDAFDMYMEMADNDCFQDSPTGTPSEEAIRMVSAGEAGAIVATNATMSQIQESAGDTEIGFYGLPGADAEEDVYLPVAMGGAYGISKDSKNVESAKKFLDFMATHQSEFSAVAYGVPTDTSQLPSDNKPLATIAEYIDAGRVSTYPDQTWPNAEVQQTHYQVIQDMFASGLSVDDALAQMQAAYDG